MVFLVVMYGCESLNIKKAERWRSVFELWCWRRLESPLDCKIKPINPKGNQSWIFIGRTDAEASIFWPPAKRCKEPTHLKRPWCWERLKAGGEGDDRGWDGWLVSPTAGREFQQALGVGEAQGSLVCCSPWGHKESVTTEWWSELRGPVYYL